MSYAIEIIDVKKNYGKHAVLKGISLHVAHGEIFGILGVNGAGKTTLLECIEGFRSYSSGTIKISGTIGVQLQASSLPPYIKVGEAISLFAKAKHVKIDPFLLNDLGIHDLQKSYIQNYLPDKKDVCTWHLLCSINRIFYFLMNRQPSLMWKEE